MKKAFLIIFVIVMVLSLIACSVGGDNEKTPENNNSKNSQHEQQSSNSEGGQSITETAEKDTASEITINFHYLREDGEYDGWELWLEPDGEDGGAHFFSSQADEKGVKATATLTTDKKRIGYIVHFNQWEKKDVDAEQFIDISDFSSDTINVYVISGKKGCEIKQEA